MGKANGKECYAWRKPISSWLARGLPGSMRQSTWPSTTNVTKTWRSRWSIATRTSLMSPNCTKSPRIVSQKTQSNTIYSGCSIDVRMSSWSPIMWLGLTATRRKLSLKTDASLMIMWSWELDHNRTTLGRLALPNTVSPWVSGKTRFG